MSISKKTIKTVSASGANGPMAIIEQDCESISQRVNLAPLRNKRVLVTGANGFIGQYIVSAIRAANKKQRLNCKIYCVSLRSPNEVLKAYLPDKNIVFKKINLAKPFKLAEKFDYIFHAAGYGQPARFVKDPFSTIAINVDATRELLGVAERSNGTFVFFSSAEVYGEMPSSVRAFKETYTGASALAGPRAVYGTSKRLGEAVCSFFADYKNVRTKIVRISHLYGPGAPKEDARVMSDFIRKASEEGEINLLDAGASVKTYGYLADSVTIIFFAALHGKERVYNVGGRDTISIRQLAERIAKQCGDAPVKVPQQTSRAAFVGKDIGFMKLDLSRITKEMKNFSFTPFKVGLANTIAWARKSR